MTVNRRMWIVAGAAAALVASGIGVAAATDRPSAAETPGYFPEVTHESRGGDDPETFYPVLQDATLDCTTTEDEFLLRYVASAQPGVQPHSAGSDLSLRAVYRDPMTFQTRPLSISGDALSTGDATPAEPGWLVVAGEATLHIPPAWQDIAVEVSVDVVRYESGSDRRQLVNQKYAITRLAFPDCT